MTVWTKGNSILLDITTVWHLVSVGDMMRIQLISTRFTNSALVFVPRKHLSAKALTNELLFIHKLAQRDGLKPPPTSAIDAVLITLPLNIRIIPHPKRSVHVLLYLVLQQLIRRSFQTYFHKEKT